MMAKIIQGRGFRGVVNYALDKDKAQLLYAEGVRLKDRESIVHSFITQSKANNILKPVAHISLNFSAQDRERMTDVFMVQVAREYLKKMGYGNTQYIVVRHSDREHPHLHLVINRIDNNGKRISDRNEKWRSMKICMELTKKHGLYISSGKENVNEERLREPDKTKYEVYHALLSAVPKCRNWKELEKELQRQGVTTSFKYKGGTSEVQGVKFGKNGYEFSGSKVDRQYSYSRIDYQLHQNSRMQEAHTQQNQSQVLPSAVEAAGSLLGDLLDIQPSGSGYDEGQAEWLRQHKKKKKSIRHGL